jgi:hypothetical protein
MMMYLLMKIKLLQIVILCVTNMNVPRSLVIINRANCIVRLLFREQAFLELVRLYNQNKINECNTCAVNPTGTRGHSCLGYGYEFDVIKATDQFLHSAVMEVDKDRLLTRFKNAIIGDEAMKGTGVVELFDIMLEQQRTKLYYDVYMTFRLAKFKQPFEPRDYSGPELGKLRKFKFIDETERVKYRCVCHDLDLSIY